MTTDSDRVSDRGETFTATPNVATFSDALPVLSIDGDPEFFHGLTFWGQMVSAQVQERGVVVVHDLPDGPDVTLTPDDARRLRDLLNLATARRYL